MEVLIPPPVAPAWRPLTVQKTNAIPTTSPARRSRGIRTNTLSSPSRSRSRQLGAWELMQSAGKGSHSEVFLSRPVNAKSGAAADYAVKQLDPRRWSNRQAVEMFVREGQCGAAVTHPNLATTLVSNTAQPPYFLVMPRLKGATTRQVLDAGETFTATKSFWIMRQIAEGLQSLHQSGWVHGDIKPSNIMLGFNSHATLFDFGFAQRITDAKRTDRELFCGTLRYTAPELLTSTRSLSPASDVYAFGSTLYELLTGRPPFSCSRPASLAESHLRIPAPSIRTALPNLSRFASKSIAAMLAKDPLRRPSSLSELTDLLTRMEVETFGLRTPAIGA